ncbi:MAG: N,N-dimethylformamidase [Gammaproteobacteria bacterium]|nr:N,N-dimethylformamidase [Gammaproteobacteria bacterium]
MEAKKIVGYLVPLCTRPGDEVSVKISSTIDANYHASLVELICGDARSRGTGYQELKIASEFEGDYPGKFQPIVMGSYARLGELMGSPEFGFTCWFYPTTPDRDQVLLQGPDLSVRLIDGRCVIRFYDSSLNLPFDLLRKRWHQLAFSVGAGSLSGKMRQLGKGTGEPEEVSVVAQVPASASPLQGGTWFLATDDPDKGGQFNGRIEAPLLATTIDLVALEQLAQKTESSLLIAAWNFSLDMAKDGFTDTSGNGYQGEFFQQPTRAVTGVKWDGSVQNWVDKPDHYGAVHFHEDDLIDAGWETDFTFRVPNNLASGVYAVKVSLSDDEEDLIPFFVSPGVDDRKCNLALLMSTATYIAYANQRMSIGTGIFGRGPRNSSDMYLVEHPEVGNSLYEHHADGSGVHFSSRLRPVLNMKPKTTTWSFNADTNLIAWLNAIEQPFDVITDEQLHYEGKSLLADYRVVITGTHPEYYSTIMLNEMTAWMDQGGRLMYMGGNGFYWRIAYHPENPAIIEVRRAEDGTRAWIADAGEYYHQFTGEYGGLWRRLGRSPNELVGVGFAAQGFDGGTHYRLNPESSDPRVGFMMEGIEEKDYIGGYGTQGGGAAGEEIDRYDVGLGSPVHAIVVASSEDHKPGMLRAKEEFHMTVQVPPSGSVRSDITFFETPSGGAVFSTGSISYAGSLSINEYTNDIARLTGNVLTRFLDPARFDYPS